MFRRKHSGDPVLDAGADDATLVAAAKTGDAEPYNLLVLRHERSVYSLAYRMMGNSA